MKLPLYSKSFLALEALAKKEINDLNETEFQLFKFNGINNYISAEFFDSYTNNHRKRFIETIIRPEKAGLLFLSHECSIWIIENNRLTYKILINFYGTENNVCHSFVSSAPIKYKEWTVRTSN